MVEKTWFYAYCLNNDLGTPNNLLNKNLKDFNAAFNNDILKKILYYGYNKNTWDQEGYDYIRRHSYYIWMPIYENGEVVN